MSDNTVSSIIWIGYFTVQVTCIVGGVYLTLQQNYWCVALFIMAMLLTPSVRNCKKE